MGSRVGPETPRFRRENLKVRSSFQDQVEAADGRGSRAAGRSRQLRRFPAPVRRSSLRLLAVPGGSTGGGACGTQHSGPLLQTSGGGSSGGQHASKAASIPPVPGSGHRARPPWTLDRSREHGTRVAVQLLQQPPVATEPAPEPAARHQAQLRGGGLAPSRLGSLDQ